MEKKIKKEMLKELKTVIVEGKVFDNSKESIEMIVKKRYEKRYKYYVLIVFFMLTKVKISDFLNPKSFWWGDAEMIIIPLDYKKKASIITYLENILRPYDGECYIALSLIREIFGKRIAQKVKKMQENLKGGKNGKNY